MKVLVTYYSETSNTEKVARAIYEGIDEASKEIHPIEAAKNLEDFDLIFCGFPVHASSVPPKVEAFLQGLPQGKMVALFATHGCLRGGHLAVTAFDNAMALASNARVIATFGCRGKVKPQLMEALGRKPEHRAWVEEAQSAAEHPDEADLEACKAYARRIVAKARSKP
jgi:flavodoxin I